MNQKYKLETALLLDIGFKGEKNIMKIIEGNKPMRGTNEILRKEISTQEEIIIKIEEEVSENGNTANI